MDKLDYSKNYRWDDLGLKTKEVETDSLKLWWEEVVVVAWEQVADTVALETDKYLSLTIKWVTYKVWIVA
jgi:hypothetical protein